MSGASKMNHTPKNKAIERLQAALDVIPQLKNTERNSPAFEKWERNTRIAISKTFATNSGHVIEFNNISYIPSLSIIGGGRASYQAAYVRGLDSAASLLESMIDEIKEYWDEDQLPKATVAAEHKAVATTNEVFVVHGKDDGAKETVARFLSKLELKPIILHEQANQGRTIVEKFEEYADVGFAVVLLTPDDTCRSAGDSDTPKFRARQNVILELGFFLGKLGRPRTFALLKGDVEIPSDYDGVIYTPLDEEDAWRMKLVKELKEAGLDVDANLAL